MEKEIPQEFWLMRHGFPFMFSLHGQSKVLKDRYIYEVGYFKPMTNDFNFIHEILSLTRLEADLQPQTRDECIDREIFMSNRKLEELKNLKNGNK